MSIDPLLVALAQAAPQAADQQLLDIDGTIFIMGGLFLIMMMAMTSLVWKPYLRVRHERSTRTEGFRRDAEKMAAEAEASFARIETELVQVRRQGAGDLASARSEAQAREQTLVAEAHARSQRELEDARRKLDAVLEKQRANLQVRAAELGREAAGKILGRSLS